MSAVRDPSTGHFLPGHNQPGPGRGIKAIRPKTFLADMEDAWVKHGAKLIRRVIKDDPSTALRVFASLVPKEMLVRSMGEEKVIDPDEARADLKRLLDDIEESNGAI